MKSTGAAFLRPDALPHTDAQPHTWDAISNIYKYNILVGTQLIQLYKFVCTISTQNSNINILSKPPFSCLLCSYITDIKTNMHHIHTSMHLARRGNNKIQHAHISSTVEIIPCVTRRNLAQLKTYKSAFHKSYLHTVDTKSHPSPLCPL